MRQSFTSQLSILLIPTVIIVMACLDAAKSENATEFVPHALPLHDALTDAVSFDFGPAAIVVKELLLAFENHP